MRPATRGLFPPASVLLSRAWWYSCDHPGAVLGLGALGSAPFAAMLLLFLREAHESVLVAGRELSALEPLALGLSAVFFARFPFRLALARWMAEAERGVASLPGALAFGLVHLPTALLYGAVSTLGWLLGAVFALPYVATLHAGYAFHRFARTDLSGWGALSAGGLPPLLGIGLRLLSVVAVVSVCAFLIVWTTPGTLLSLAEWLLRMDVAGLRPVLSPSSPSWLAVAIVLPLLGAELLWSVALGLLAADWARLTAGSDLSAALDDLDRRASSREAFA